MPGASRSRGHAPATLQDAAKLREEQAQAKRQAKQDIKERNKRRMLSREAERGPRAPSDDDEAAEDLEIDEADMLPEDVIAAMADQEEEDRRTLERRIVSEQLRAPKRKKKKSRAFERRAGPVTLQVLNATRGREVSGESGTALGTALIVWYH